MGAGGCRMLGYLYVYFILYDSVDCCKCRGRADRQTGGENAKICRQTCIFLSSQFCIWTRLELQTSDGGGEERLR